MTGRARERRKAGRLDFIGAVEDGGSRIRIFSEFCVGLRGLENFSHIIVLYWFHLRDNEKERKTLRLFRDDIRERRKLASSHAEVRVDQTLSDSAL